MNITSIVANIFQWIISIIILTFAQSKDNIINISKLIVISTSILILFLYAAGYVFPGGSVHYTDWALAIVNDTKLPLGHAQREVGMPLLYIITGFTYFKSFIGITLAYGIFAILIVIAHYISISNISQSIAYYSSMVLIATLAPFSYIKFFYPDQLYIFLMQIFLMYMVLFIWKEKIIFLYFFALFAIAASLTRTSGNLLFISLLITLYFFKRAHLKHYLACLLIGIAVFGINQNHRFNVFNLANETETKPVGKGYQILYSTYMWMGQFGYKITPELGPNSKLLIDRMREELSPSPRQSKLVANQYGQTPNEFMEQNVYNYNTEELIYKVITEPCEEYFYNIILPIKRVGVSVNNTDDEFHLNIVKEIWMGYPLYIIKYGLRNLGLMLFDPGWSSPRYVKAQFVRQGVEFVGSSYSWGAYSADSVANISERAAREHEFYQLKLLPSRIQTAFAQIKDFHRRHFRNYVYATSIIMIIGWILTFNFYLERVTGIIFISYDLSKDILNKLFASITLTSFVLIYESAMTAWFSQPHFRYFHMTESCRFIIVSLAVVLIFRLSIFRGYILMYKVNNLLTNSKAKLFDNSLTNKRKAIIVFVCILNALALSIWAKDIIDNTWGERQINIINAYTSNDSGEKIYLDNDKKLKIEECNYFKCDITLQEHYELPNLIDTKNWNLIIEYHCKSRNEKRVSRSRKEGKISKIELNCY